MDAVERLPVPLLKFLYPLKEDIHTRTKELKVLCLGLGRTGTASLRHALYDLGYSEVYHGWRVGEGGIYEIPQWYRLSLAKFRDHDTAFLNRAEFDKVLGDCEAATDLPVAPFALELIRAYPEAKIVLNRRQDVQKWHRSMLATLGAMYHDWGSWTRQWVDSENFWLMRIIRWNLHAAYDWDIPGKGVEVYNRHYAEVEAECKKQGREWLDWTVEDGWEPLCKFLEKPVPDTPFPDENNPDGFTAKRLQLHRERHDRGNRKVAMYGLFLTAGIVGGVAWWMNPDRASEFVRGSLRRIASSVKSVTS